MSTNESTSPRAHPRSQTLPCSETRFVATGDTAPMSNAPTHGESPPLYSTIPNKINRLVHHLVSVVPRKPPQRKSINSDPSLPPVKCDSEPRIRPELDYSGNVSLIERRTLGIGFSRARLELLQGQLILYRARVCYVSSNSSNTRQVLLLITGAGGRSEQCHCISRKCLIVCDQACRACQSKASIPSDGSICMFDTSKNERQRARESERERERVLICAWIPGNDYICCTKLIRSSNMGQCNSNSTTRVH
jgi:hypothetical protein